MKLMTRHKNLILLICSLNVLQVLGFPDNSDHKTTPAPKYPKSTKFLTALCKNKNEIPNLNRNTIGGEQAGIGEFPFQVALGYKDQNNEIDYNCGGSLIADDIVLTAAHCANRSDAVPVSVKLGRASLIPDEYDYEDGEDIQIQVKFLSIY